MQAPDQHRAEATGTSRVGLVRGIVVILTAVAIGGFMVAQGLDRDADVVAAGETVTVGDDVAGTTATDEVALEGPAVDSETVDDTTSASADVGADDGSAPATGADGDGDTEAQTPPAADETAETNEATDTTETTGPAGPAEEQTVEVKILVLNGAGAKGIAGRGSEILSDAGYEVLAPKNADVLGPSQVLFLDGAEEEARAVAEVFGTDPDAVVAPLDPASPPIGDTRDATIVVVVGQDGLIEV